MNKAIYVVLLILIFSVLCFGQDAFNLYGNGARAAGMGNAFTGLADDASAISWNPAGLIQLNAMEASVVTRFGFGSASYDFPGDFGIDSWDIETQSNFQFNFGSFIVPINIGDRRIVAGVSYRNLYDLNSYSKETVQPAGILNFDEAISDESGGVNAISPAVAVPLTDNFSIGATANILSGKYESTNEVDGNVTSESNLDFSGLSFDIGALFKASNQFSIGANFNLPHTLTWEFPEFDLDMKVPLFFSVGAAFRTSDVLTLVFDYRNRGWSNAEFEVDGETIENFLSFEDANSFHVGLEYLVTSGNSFVPLRLGYNTIPLLFTDANDETITGHNITAGIGFFLGKLILDAAFEYSIINYDIFEDVTYNQNNFRITLGGVIHLN